MDVKRSDSVRSVRIETLQRARPKVLRQLSRKDTAREAVENIKVYQNRFETEPFADPKRVRAFPFGPQVYTEEHVLLLRRLRGEGARLSQELAESRNKVSLLQREKADLWSTTVVQRADLSRLHGRLDSVSNALLSAQTHLEEMDRVYAANKRQSRAIADFTLDLAGLADGDARPSSPAAGPSRRA